MAWPGASVPVTSHSEKMMTTEPTMNDRTMAMSGRARMLPARLSRSLMRRSRIPRRYRRP